MVEGIANNCDLRKLRRLLAGNHIPGGELLLEVLPQQCHELLGDFPGLAPINDLRRQSAGIGLVLLDVPENELDLAMEHRQLLVQELDEGPVRVRRAHLDLSAPDRRVLVPPAPPAAEALGVLAHLSHSLEHRRPVPAELVDQLRGGLIVA